MKVPWLRLVNRYVLRWTGRVLARDAESGKWVVLYAMPPGDE